MAYSAGTTDGFEKEIVVQVREICLEVGRFLLAAPLIFCILLFALFIEVDKFLDDL